MCVCVTVKVDDVDARCMLHAASCAKVDDVALRAAVCMPLAVLLRAVIVDACAKSSPVQVRSPDQWSSRLRRARA